MRIEFEFDWVYEQKNFSHWTLDAFEQHIGGVMPPNVNHKHKWTAYFELEEVPMCHFDTEEEAKKWVIDQLHDWCKRNDTVTFFD